jgi:hypothetical protein
MMDTQAFLESVSAVVGQEYEFDDVWQMFVNKTREVGILPFVISHKPSFDRDYCATLFEIEGDNSIDLKILTGKDPYLLIVSRNVTRWGRGLFGVPLTKSDLRDLVGDNFITKNPRRKANGVCG